MEYGNNRIFAIITGWEELIWTSYPVEQEWGGVLFKITVFIMDEARGNNYGKCESASAYLLLEEKNRSLAISGVTH
jgi:hypothetical protein